MMASRKHLPFAAVLALAAWANAQAMACCWVTDAWESLRSGASEIVETASSGASMAPMAADHSCCPGSQNTEEAESSSPSTSDETMSGCVRAAEGVASRCCESGETAVSSTPSGSAHDGVSGAVGKIILTESRFGVVSGPESPPLLVLSSPPDGTPPFLSFQRLLI
jgi:hypothetical protein